MKKVILLTTLLAFMGAPMVLADEVQESLPIQETNIESSGAVAVINKQPEETGIVQKVKVRKCGLILIVNINGKVHVAPDTKK